jgi:multisubunit Na+/H+ antiporter MnhC subunit
VCRRCAEGLLFHFSIVIALGFFVLCLYRDVAMHVFGLSVISAKVYKY